MVLRTVTAEAVLRGGGGREVGGRARRSARVRPGILLSGALLLQGPLRAAQHRAQQQQQQQQQQQLLQQGQRSSSSSSSRANAAAAAGAPLT
jgi:hypothetical protein